jgi:hypothetical protein
METVRSPRLWWLALTLPLPVAALVLYTSLEWLFFVTKPSVVSVLPWSDRLAILVQAPSPFIPFLLAIQIPVTILSIAAFQRLRAVAVVPAGIVLGLLFLSLIDNFTYVVFGFASTNVDVGLRYAYVLLLLVLVVTATYQLNRYLNEGSARAAVRKAVVIVLMVLPSFIGFAISEVKGPPAISSSVEAQRPSGNQRPNVLFLTMDGVEAETMSAYGYGQPNTPYMASLRDETLFFENSFSNACRTYGSLVSLVTGRLPTHTRVLDPPSMLDGDARYQHLPGILRQHGYRTLQLTMKLFADATSANLVGAFDQANYDWEAIRFAPVDGASDTARLFRLQVFDRLQDRLTRIFTGQEKDGFALLVSDATDAPPKSYFWRDEKRAKTLLEFVDATDEPWFAQVHLVDTHMGVDADQPLDVQLRNTDNRVRTVVEGLRARGVLDRTIVVIGADHGRAWQSRVRLPLMIRFPNGQHARRERGNAQLVDVAPTTLDALGLPIPTWMDGASLLRPIPAERPVISLCGAGDVGERTSFLRKSRLRQPNFGARTAMIFLGSWRYELDLLNGNFAVAPVEGHTLRSSSDPVAARALLQEHLVAAGFRVVRPHAVQISRGAG